MVSWDYAAGYFDGEGHAGIYRDGSWRLIWSNTDRPSLEAIHALIGFGVMVERKRHGGLGKKTMYNLEIRRVEELRIICPELIKRCLAKREALERLLAHIENRPSRHVNFNKLAQMPDEFFRSTHWDLNKSTLQIAQELGVCHVAVASLMRRRGIPRRSRQEAVRLVFSNGRWQKKTAPLLNVTPEEVNRLYWHERLNLREVAAHFHVHRASMTSYMKRHTIPLRSRSDRSALARNQPLPRSSR